MMTDEFTTTKALGWIDAERMKKDYELVQTYLGMEKPFDVGNGVFTTRMLDSVDEDGCEQGEEVKGEGRRALSATLRYLAVWPRLLAMPGAPGGRHRIGAAGRSAYLTAARRDVGSIG